MATTTVTDAIVVPQDPGTGLPDTDDPVSAASIGLLSRYTGGKYVISQYSEGMGFVSRSAANDTVTVGKGACFITDTSSSTNNSRGSNGNPSVQSKDDGSNPPTYNTELPSGMTYLVIFPSQVTVNCSDSTLNDIWVNVTSISSNNSVEVRSSGGGGTTSQPSDTYLKIGEANPDDSSQDVRPNEFYNYQYKKEGVATLSSGSTVVSTGVTSTGNYFTVQLDPSGGGNNTSDVKASARAFWDNSAGEYKVEILEDGTSVGNPDVGYRIVMT